MTIEQLIEGIDSIEEATPFTGFIPMFPNSSKAIANLLPAPAATPRAYSNEPIFIKNPLINVQSVEIRKNELYKKFNISSAPITTSNNITTDQMEKYAYECLKSYNCTNADIKYIDVVRSDRSVIEYRFAIERWLYDNFNGVTPIYRPIALLEFPVKFAVPNFFRDNTNSINGHIESRFEQFMATRKNKLLNSNLSFLKKIDTSMFVYKYTHAGATHITAALRHTVVMGALAIYTSMFFNKNLTSKQEKSIHDSASRLADTDKLNSYLKNLK